MELGFFSYFCQPTQENMDREKNDILRRFEQYLHHDDPSKRKRALTWATAIGLQRVDGLNVSEYLLSVACRNIEGEITSEEAVKLIDSYYDNRNQCQPNK